MKCTDTALVLRSIHPRARRPLRAACAASLQRAAGRGKACTEPPPPASHPRPLRLPGLLGLDRHTWAHPPSLPRTLRLGRPQEGGPPSLMGTTRGDVTTSVCEASRTFLYLFLLWTRSAVGKEFPLTCPCLVTMKGSRSCVAGFTRRHPSSAAGPLSPSPSPPPHRSCAATAARARATHQGL